jgi:hypothetical protein
MSSTRPRSRTPTAARVRKHREGLCAAGLRPHTNLGPRRALEALCCAGPAPVAAIAQSAREQDDLAFIESIADWNAT